MYSLPEDYFIKHKMGKIKAGKCCVLQVCQKMGWKGKEGMWDVLPLVLQANGMDPEMFEIPQDLILEIPIKHPK